MKIFKFKFLFLLSLCFSFVSCGNNNESSEIIDSFSSQIEESQTSSEESTESESVVSDPITLNADSFPTSNAGGYPSDGEYNIGGHNFFLSDVMQNNGKYSPTLTIQMKKNVGYFYNINPIYGLTLDITIMKNENEYAGVMHHPLSLYVSNSTTFTEHQILATEISNTDTTITYLYEGSNEFTHFKISNDSDYAQYLYELSWKR